MMLVYLDDCKTLMNTKAIGPENGRKRHKGRFNVIMAYLFQL